MNQDNKEFELSGTLGNLNDAALNNLANQNTNVNTANNLETNNVISEDTIEPISTEIEMLDISSPTIETIGNNNNVGASSVQTEQLNSINNEFNSLNLEPSNAIPSQPTLDPIPTNFDIGDIGSVPPIDPTGRSNKPKKKNKVLFIILVIVFILAIGALVYYYLRVSKGSISKAVETKNLNYELGEELPTDINEYATFKTVSSSNCILDTKSIDIKKAGTYEYTITCGNKSYTGNITLKDSKAPEVKTKTIVKKVNDTIAPEEFVEVCQESTECTYAFENPEVVQNNTLQAGTYEFNIIITDTNNNSTTSPVKLIVIDSDIKVYLNCVLAEQGEDGFNGTISFIDRIGISPESQYVGIYFRIKEFIVSTEEEYNAIKTNFIENNTLSINNGEGTPLFDDTNLTITFEETLSGQADFGADYTSIKQHYETTNNYKCNIMNVN